MTERSQRLVDLSRDQCFEHLRRAAIGRIGYVVDGMAVILPVNFTMRDEDIVFCTDSGSKLRWLSNHTRVAFEVDGSNAENQSGWSVLVRGTARPVTDADSIDALRAEKVVSWVRPPDAHWVRISVDQVSGRSLAAAEQPSASAEAH
jgi:nitroimidazol reductase NimA-like FMN-containing flavoprotein (pyridoxamine 5'-phosphate oxidase superfamily)